MKSVLRLLPGLIAFAGFAFLSSCNNDPDPVAPGAEGYYVVNEGAFGKNNSSLSFYDRAKDEITNDVFQSKNNRPLGDQAQSMTIHDGKGYIIVQNSSKVEVIDLADNSSIKTITANIESPRYFVGLSSSKGYLSDWGSDGVSGTVKVIDLQSFTVVKTIDVGMGPNKMLLVGSKLYVPNSGGFGKDNSIKVIDVNTDAVIQTKETNDNPNSIQADFQGNLWIACAGHIVYNSDFSINENESTHGSIVKLKPDLEFIEAYFLDGFSYPPVGQLDIDPEKKTIYFNYEGSIFSRDVTTNPGSSPLIQPLITKGYYGFSIDPFTGDIIGGLAPNFSSAGSIEVRGSDGVLKKTFTAGIAPNGCAFK